MAVVHKNILNVSSTSDRLLQTGCCSSSLSSDGSCCSVAAYVSWASRVWRGKCRGVPGGPPAIEWPLCRVTTMLLAVIWGLGGARANICGLGGVPILPGKWCTALP